MEVLIAIIGVMVVVFMLWFVYKILAAIFGLVFGLPVKIIKGAIVDSYDTDIETAKKQKEGLDIRYKLGIIDEKEFKTEFKSAAWREKRKQRRRDRF